MMPVIGDIFKVMSQSRLIQYFDFRVNFLCWILYVYRQAHIRELKKKPIGQ